MKSVFNTIFGIIAVILIMPFAIMLSYVYAIHFSALDYLKSIGYKGMHR